MAYNKLRVKRQISIISCVLLSLFQAQNVESSIFSELFPGVPVVGLFGNGEFGYDSLGGRGTPGRSRQWQHSYTSVFVLLNFEPTSGRVSPEESSVPSEGHH